MINLALRRDPSRLDLRINPTADQAGNNDSPRSSLLYGVLIYSASHVRGILALCSTALANFSVQPGIYLIHLALGSHHRLTPMSEVMLSSKHELLN